MSLTDLPIELVAEIARFNRLVYWPLVVAYPAFARSLTLGDRLDYAEAFGHDCRVQFDYNSNMHRIVWTLRGRFHRTDGPAVEWADGDKHWIIHGKLHREDGPAVEFRILKSWYKYGRRHREDGPAITRPEYVEWWLNGRRHRLDGPAFIGPGGKCKYYVDDIHYYDYDSYMQAIAELGR